jgi:hypothetical protein
LGRILDLAEHAPVALTATIGLSSSILPLGSVTSWTFNHFGILAYLAQILATLYTQTIGLNAVELLF